MAASDALFAGSIPDIYDRLLVPLIFEPYATDLAKRVAEAKPQLVLETAAGTGAVTRALASSLKDARIVATDLNQPMLDHARSRQSGDKRIEWRQADALELPFKDQTFDAVACQFGLMFFPDKVQGYREARRVLKPSGRFFFSVWDRISENEFADVVTQALATFFPQDPPRFLARTPHGYCDTNRIREEMSRAGFGTVSIDVVDARSKASSARDVAVAYCQGTPLRTSRKGSGGALWRRGRRWSYPSNRHDSHSLKQVRFKRYAAEIPNHGVAQRTCSLIQSERELRHKSRAAPI
jgi:ubiquinone/menaquinone biosynthesis C-methylase UbiE